MLWNDWSPGFDATVEVANVKQALGTPENLAAALGYYRATLGDGYKDPPSATATKTQPTTPLRPTCPR